MKVVFTEAALEGMEELMDFLMNEQKLSVEKVLSIADELMNKANQLETTYLQNQKEILLNKEKREYRRLIHKHIKIIYWIEGDLIKIADFFDTRQDPQKMKG